MQCPVLFEPLAPAQAQSKPHLTSYDSCQECSLAHWLEVCRLVELAEIEDRKPKLDAFDDSLVLVSQ
jgi:hypothetical protein